GICRRVERIVGPIEAAPAVDGVVAAASIEYFDRARGVVAAEQLVGESRPNDGPKPGTNKDVGSHPCKVATGSTVSGARSEVDRDPRCRADIGDACEQRT